MNQRQIGGNYEARIYREDLCRLAGEDNRHTSVSADRGLDL